MKQAYILKFAMIALLSLGGVGSVGGGFFLTQAFNNKKETEIVVDNSNYQEIRHNTWSNQTQINHFPAIIPSVAKDVRVIFYPGFSRIRQNFSTEDEIIKTADKKST